MTIQEQKREYITDRIFELCAQGTSKAEIARRLHILPQSLNNILNGTRNISDKFYSSFQEAFGNDDHSPARPSGVADKATITDRFVESVQYIQAARIAGSKAEIAATLGVLPSKLSEVLNHRMMVGTDMLANTCLSYGISASWLLTGEGGMCDDGKSVHAMDKMWSHMEFLAEQIREKDRQIGSLLGLLGEKGE